jgi:hypothetical protein
MARLVTSRYTTPGVYIGQLITPKGGNLAADARVTDYIGRGSRLAVGRNLPIRRSFIFDETLTLPSIPPYETILAYPSDGTKDRPVRVFDSLTGRELRQDEWDFTKVGPYFQKVIISPQTFSPQAVYKIDYQSVSRNINDPLPVGDLRNIKALGNQPDRAQYKDFKDFYVPFSFVSPVADPANFLTDSILTSIFPDGSNLGAGTISQAMTSEFAHDYNRFYELEVVSVGGAPSSFNATFTWKARPYSGGLYAEPPVPLNLAAPAPTFNADETNPPSLEQELEHGIKVSIAFDLGTNFSVGDKFYFNGVGPGLIEFDGRLLNSNQYLLYGPVVASLIGGSTGAVSHAADTDYSGDYNNKYRIECINAGGPFGARFATFVWAAYGETIGANGTFTINEGSSLDVSLSQGIKVSMSFGAGNYVIGDEFDFAILAPRTFYQAKDDRVLSLSISSATNPGADTGVVTGAYSTGTPEGGYGSWTANVNNLIGPSAEEGYFSVKDGLSLAVRNAIRGNINGTSYQASDEFVGSVSSTNQIDWSLTAKIEETRELAGVRTDVTGQITGTAGSLYVTLDNIYDVGSVEIKDSVTLLTVSHVEIPGTRFVQLMSMPVNTIIINYSYRGEEPAPGQLYYLTAEYLRPASLYNNPTLILDRQSGRDFLAPSESNNHLYIMNELAFANNAPACYYTQPQDGDGDGILNTTDVDAALTAHEGISRATDLCLLSLIDSLSASLAVNEKANDPFEKREQMLWVGMPIGTPIGDIDTQDSLVFTARRTLQTTPQSGARGTRVLVAPTQATMTLALDNGVTQSVTLDGSFVAGATSALVNSFADPATTILRKNLSGFDSIQVYTEPQNSILGNASITFMSNQGNSVYRFEEDVTVHSDDEEFQLISATIQKQYVTKVVRREMDSQLISVVLPSPAATIAFIRATLGAILIGILGRGIIANYQDEAGNPREFDSNADIVILRDTSSLTKYDFWYAFWIRTPLKRLFGLYAVNTNDFGQTL